jgi:hypothetical protein
MPKTIDTPSGRTAFAEAGSALGLVFDGVERPVSGSCDLLLDGMVGSTAAVRAGR